ncbi:MAG: 2-dehydropantoate 2-reductase [Akkermansiaceae bacterium]|nr:2-dehydropantoate 2-reductase [Verrucomicrobiales bacterium]
MKIAIVGCGALGSFYGARLCRDGKDVHFLLRSDYEAVRRKGVFIQSPEGDFNVRPRCARTPEEIGVSDLVIIALKATANDQFPKLLPPLVGPETTVLTLQNGLGNEEQLARLFRCEQIMGGLCFVCLNRMEPGVVRHMDHGMVVLGEFQRWPEPRTHDIASLFRHAGITCKVTDNLAQAHWEKLVWNIPFNGLGVASAAGIESLSGAECQEAEVLQPCLTTDRLLADARWENLVNELMLEVIRTANALGFSVSETLARKQIEKTRTMGAYKASTLVDFERGQPLELESLFLEPLRQARKGGVSVPRLERLAGVLRKLATRPGFSSGPPA